MFGYYMEDKYGSLGPLSTSRLSRIIYSRQVMPSDPDGVPAPGNAVVFDLHIPQLDLTKGALITYLSSLVLPNNYQYCSYIYDAANPHIYGIEGGTWNNTTKILNFQLSSLPVNAGNGKVVHGVMFE